MWSAIQEEMPELAEFMVAMREFGTPVRLVELIIKGERLR